jgi:hypothetical protein
MSGHGVYSYKNGDIYEGGFLNGKRFGLGLLKLIDGDTY